MATGTQLPGVHTVKPSRLKPRFHYELLVCGVQGHELIGLDARALGPGDGLLAREMDGIRWYRCLRCDSWLPVDPPGPPVRDTPPTREEIDLPLRGRPLRDKIVLRLIAINRAVHFLVLGALASFIFLFASHRDALRERTFRVIADLQTGTAGAASGDHGVVHDVQRAFSLESGTLRLVGAVLAAYALVEGVEAVGLWYQRRWAEYLTLIVTASLLPLELYELAHSLSPLKLLTLIINVAVVLYLLLAKRLFGLRGGVAAEQRERQADIGWEALQRTTPEAVAGARAAT